MFAGLLDRPRIVGCDRRQPGPGIRAASGGVSLPSPQLFFLLPEMVQCDFHAAQIKQIHIYSLPSRPHVPASQILIWELLERQIYL